MPEDRSGGAPPGAPRAASPVPERRCGRCRSAFAGDPTLHHPPAGPPAWWLCPPCRAALLGGPPEERAPVASRPQPGRR